MAEAGCIVRDDQGWVLMVATQPELLSEDPLEVELRAILRGLQMCLLMGVNQLVVEIDCLVAIQVVEEGPDSHAEYRYLI